MTIQTNLIKGFVQNLQEGTSNPALKQVLQLFNEFVELFSQRNDVHVNAHEFYGRLHTAYQNLWAALQDMGHAQGLSNDDIGRFFADPSGFSPERWKNLENFSALRQEIGSKKKKKKTLHKKMV